ncbi:MAG: ROK family protein [Actinomycetota bacterium]
MEFALAVDVGGTKLAAGVVDEHGRLHDRCSTATPNGSASGGADEVFTALTDLLGRFAPFDQFSVCGVGCAGPLSPDRELVSPLNIPALRDFPLAKRLRDHTGLACAVDNDAKALALAEAWVGGAVGVTDFVAMVVSTGIGSGIVLEGRLLDGASGNAGHIGQMVVADPGRPFPPQVQGTLEAEAAGPAIAAHTGHVPAEATTAAVAECGTFVGRAAGSVANLLDLRLVLVAGSVALSFGEPFFAAAQAEMDRVCQLDFSRGARIEPAGCGDEGPLIGAAAVGLRWRGQPIGVIEAR